MLHNLHAKSYLYTLISNIFTLQIQLLEQQALISTTGYYFSNFMIMTYADLAQ